MKKLYSLLILFCFVFTANAQTICSPSGNLLLFSNYDGGNLNINVDVNIPNLKIGVVSYEGTTIVLSGTFVSNVTAVKYAGFNSNNPHCGAPISTTITGAPGGASTSIVLYPTVTLANPNGYGSIICAYSCSTTTSQGGCNTVDQVEAYFLNAFPGSSVYAHKVQYGCWSGTQNMSGGGTCCALTTNLSSILNDLSLEIYPNPSNETIYVQTIQKVKSVSCQNYLGQLTELMFVDNSIDITGLSDGMYFLNITTENGKHIIKKFVKN